MRLAIAAALAALLTPITPAAHAADPQFPELTGRVVDTADEIPADVETRLEADLADFERRSGHQMVVVTVPDLNGVPKEDYAYRIGRHWGIGRKGVDDGIVMLQSPGDGRPGSGRIYVAVGYGLEGVLTDAQASVVVNQVMLPILKGDAGSAGEGLDKPARVAPAIVAGAAEIMRQAAITPEQRAEDERRLAAERARASQRAKDAFAIFLTWIAGIAATILGGWGAWMLATRKRRARERAEAAERQRLAEIAAAQRRREAEEAARLAAEERRRLAEEAQRRREEMLARMTPEARAQLLAAEERERREAAERERAEADRRARLRREQEKRDRQARRERENREARDAATNATILGTGGGFSPSPSPSPSPSNFSGGGGSFGGGGAGSDY